MKVKIEYGERHFSIGLPNALVLNRFSACLLIHSIYRYKSANRGIIKKKEWRNRRHKYKKLLNCLFREIRNAKREDPRWTLVEVQTVGGNHIFVFL